MVYVWQIITKKSQIVDEASSECSLRVLIVGSYNRQFFEIEYNPYFSACVETSNKAETWLVDTRELPMNFKFHRRQTVHSQILELP